ncbi:MAG: pyroglutamyl-peptidase I [Anaerolineaceae bacterium]|nr:pyroglutamyl-peptidase I [Anaerolineaceae bacterium]
MKIILTGFEPFNGSKVNPSAEVVNRITHGLFPEHKLIRRVLPVDSVVAIDWMKRVILDQQPDIIIMLGEASLRPVVSIEKIAVNWMDFQIPDNSGNQLFDTSVVKEGTDGLFSTLPVSEIFSALKTVGIPAEISLTAGAFLCNQLFYTGLFYSKFFEKKNQCGFIHLPPLPEQIVEKDAASPSMHIELSLKAIEIAIQTCIESKKAG